MRHKFFDFVLFWFLLACLPLAVVASPSERQGPEAQGQHGFFCLAWSPPLVKCEAIGFWDLNRFEWHAYDQEVRQMEDYDNQMVAFLFVQTDRWTVIELDYGGQLVGKTLARWHNNKIQFKKWR